MAFSFTGKSIIGMAEISTFGNPMNDMVACLTKGGLYVATVSYRFKYREMTTYSETSSTRIRIVPTIPRNSTQTAEQIIAYK